MEVATVRAAVLAKEARQAQEEEEARAGEKGGKGGRHRTSGSSGDSFGGGVLGANLSWGLLRKDSALLASQREAEEEEGRGALLVDGGQNTLFSRRSALRLRALRRCLGLGLLCCVGVLLCRVSGRRYRQRQDDSGVLSCACALFCTM